MMDNTPIINLINEYNELRDYLSTNGQLTYAVGISNHYKKILLLSCASLYEKFFVEEMMRIIKVKTNNCESLSLLFYNKSIKQQYFKFFNWKEDGGKITDFLKLFGNTVQEVIQAEIKASPEYQIGMNSFLKIGYNRNLLVHENFIV